MRVSQLGIGTTLPIPSIQDLKNAPHADASKNNKHRRNSSQMVALASDSNRINNQFNTRCDHTSTQIYNLPADMPSGLRNIYMRRKWSAPDLNEKIPEGPRQLPMTSELPMARWKLQGHGLFPPVA